jgi:hypothetical protein
VLVFISQFAVAITFRTDFVDGFIEYITSDEYNAYASLQPFAANGLSSSLTIYHKRSLVHILLGNQSTQKDVVSILLENFPLYLDSEDSEICKLPTTILHHIKSIDIVFCGEELISKLFQLISVCPQSLQKEIIACIPEVTDEIPQKVLVVIYSINACSVFYLFGFFDAICFRFMFLSFL